ncbi:hypothetical protein SEA_VALENTINIPUFF_95 [Microbacterium phage ValentiniPuff]|uniref:YqaJ viral recombinase domain-containing protein n=1 Tax=Microbacterium phage ValentiniPuff TaxID=2315705 RepID=A0A386KQZ5_9CAUD|nr:hypothetical protein SEA_VALENTINIPUFF_95 [Microbacterium phage ValentiniPuff]
MSYTTLLTDEQIQNDPDAWLTLRADDFRIGASESAAILGLSPWSTPLDVWESKQPGAEPIQETRFMTWGKRLEATIADAAAVDFHDRVGTVLPSPGLLSWNEVPFITSTPDRENAFGPAASTPVTAVMEIKNSSAYARSAWFADDGSEIVPPYYEVQVQQQMAVRGVRRAFVVALLGGNDLIIREVLYSPSFVELLVDELDEWRSKYLLTGERPPASPADAWRFNGKPKGAPDAQIIASPLILDLVQQRNTIQPASSALTKADDAVKGQIKAFMGDQTELVDADGNVLVTWYQGNPKTSFDVKAFAAAHPAIYEEFIVEKPGSRSMLFKSKDSGIYVPIDTGLRVASLAPEGIPAEDVA